MMSSLEEKMKSMINTNEKVVKSYAQAVNMSSSSAKPPQVPQPTPSQDRTTLHLLDEFSDRERRKGNLVIHNIPESQDDSLAGRSTADALSVAKLIRDGLNIEDVEFTRTIRLGGKGQNRANKPRLILATMSTPMRKRAILASAKTLRSTDEWANIYISPDLTPKEREDGKALREALKTRRDKGEQNLTIRTNRIIQLPAKNTPTIEAAMQIVVQPEPEARPDDTQTEPVAAVIQDSK